MIIRAQRRTNFTMISNVGLEDPRMSFKAKGLLAYLLSKPDHWRISDRHLATASKDGRDAVQAGLKELERFGYLVRRKEHGSDGRWVHFSMIFDEPQVDGDDPAPVPADVLVETEDGDLEDDPNVTIPMADNTMAGKADHGKARLIVSTEVVKTDLAKTEKAKAAPQAARAAAPAPPPAALAVALSTAVGWNWATLSAKQRKQVEAAAGALVNESYSADDVAAYVRDVWKKDWRWKRNKEYPTLAIIRAEIGRVNDKPDVSMLPKGTALAMMQPQGNAPADFKPRRPTMMDLYPEDAPDDEDA